MKFSIIVPCYNLERYIGEALDSVLAQTFADYECIVVDDGSTDNSPRIVDEYVARDPRIKVIHKPNGGEGSARNAGLDVAQGEWIAYLDGDDVWAHYALEQISKLMEQCPESDMVGFTGRRFDDGSPYPWVRGECQMTIRPGSVKTYDVSRTLRQQVTWRGFTKYVYRRQRFEDIRFADYKWGADRVYLMRCLAVGDKIVVGEIDTYGYRRRSGSAVSDAISARRVENRIRYITEILVLFNSMAKRAEREVWRSFVNIFSEGIVGMIVDLPSADQGSVWSLWFEKANMIVRFKDMTRWQRFRLRVSVVTHSRWVAVAVFGWPYRVKCAWGHRRLKGR